MAGFRHSEEEWQERLLDAGRYIRARRTKLGWSQEKFVRKLAAELGHLSVTQSTVSKWEAGKASPDPARVTGIERTLGLDPNDLAHRLFGPAPARVPADRSTIDLLARQVEALADQLAGLRTAVETLAHRSEETDPRESA